MVHVPKQTEFSFPTKGRVFHLRGARLGEGSGMSWLPRKYQRNQPESSWASRGHACSHLRRVLPRHQVASPPTHPTLSPGRFSTSLRLKCFHAFLSLSFSTCLSDVGEKSLQRCHGGQKYGVALGAVATVKAHACDLLRNSFNQLECMHKFVFGNYLFKLFNKKCMSKHPYQYFFWCFF